MGEHDQFNGSGTNGSLRQMDRYLMEKIDKLSDMQEGIAEIRTNQGNLEKKLDGFIATHVEEDEKWIDKQFVPVKNKVDWIMKYVWIATGIVLVLSFFCSGAAADAFRFWFSSKV